TWRWFVGVRRYAAVVCCLTVVEPEPASLLLIPEMVTCAAFCVPQAGVGDPPLGIVLGVAVKEEIAGVPIVCPVTVTPTLAVAVPPDPVAVRRNEVLSVGVTVVEPDGASEPLTPVIVTDVAFCLSPFRVPG